MLSILCMGTVYGQRIKSIKIKDPIICHYTTENNPIYIAPPKEYLEYLNNPNARIKTATIEVTYIGFSDEAKAAFQQAVDIWETLIESPVPIRIEATWASLGPGVLGSAIYTSAFANFTGAQKIDVYYPVSIAEKIIGRELNNGEADLVANFNSNNSLWHFDANTPPAAGKYDLTTVVLHEIGHGLGFAGTFDVNSTEGEYGLVGSGIPVIYDVPIQNGSGAFLIEQFTSPSASLRTQLVGNNLFFNSPTSTLPKLYAPTTFNGGSSISHLDEVTFNSSGNALMTPQVAAQEQILNPGIAANMLYDMGWRVLKINHQRLFDTETTSGSYTINATIIAEENGFDPSTFKLYYTINGTTFTTVNMTATGTPDQYTAVIPSTGAAQTYGYYLSAKDGNGTEFVNPGKIVANLKSQEQSLFVFETGPDTQAPKITHNQKPFLLDSETELVIDARVTDNISIGSVTLEYFINDVPQSPLPLSLIAPEEDSIYTTTIIFGQALTNGDKVTYRILASDNASAGPFQTISPASGLYTVNVVGLAPTQESYTNNFNTVTDDFFGTGFTIKIQSGFTDEAIHSEHPYIAGDGFPNNERNLIYQLRVPIKVKANDGVIKFDEVVLIEPGESGSVFGDDEFWDYVVVEGSKDGGVTWIPVADGYDSRDYSPWLTKYNSSITDNSSTALGDPSLFKTRTLSLLNKFTVDDEVVIRFRLYSDQLAVGWGWAIDNLKIQIDDTPPKILHSHTDYLLTGTDELLLSAKVSDGSGVEEFKLEYSVNGGELMSTSFEIPASEYIFSFTGLSTLAANDFVEYRWIAKDAVGNEAFTPSTGFLKVRMITFANPVSTYVNNFNAASSDFVGNYFSITQPSGFSNGAIHSTHSYPLGSGYDLTSSLTYTLTKPITIAAQNTYIRFDEVALVAGNDNVIVEGSKDNGVTWLPVEAGYNNSKKPTWISAFNNNINGSSALFFTNVIDLTANGNFATGDNVILRFRLFTSEIVNGWGWVIDNLYIQDPITSRERELEKAITVYPNPTRNNLIIEASGLNSAPVNIQVLSTQGQLLYSSQTQSVDGNLNHLISSDVLPKGLFFVKIFTEGSQIIRKVIKVN
jgi:hypothetical protein